jgi:hypothetical protein
MNEQLFLGFVRYVGQEADKRYVYELFFTHDKDNVWGDDFGELPASCAAELVPYDDTYDCIKRLKTDFRMITIPESTQFSVQDAIDHCTCLAYEDVAEKKYPELRLIFQYGEPIEEVEHDLVQKGFSFEE